MKCLHAATFFPLKEIADISRLPNCSDGVEVFLPNSG